MSFLHSVSCSIFLIACFLFAVIFGGCTTHVSTVNAAQTFLPSSIVISRELQDYRSPVAKYVATLATELIISSPYFFQRVDPIRTGLITTPEVGAVSTNDRHIFLSVGLLKALNNEAELAFVLSHEMCHFALNHFSENKREGKIRELEFAADRCALVVTTNSGYNPFAAIPAVSRIDRSLTRENNDITHPSAQERSEMLVNSIDYLKISEGIGDRRRFRVAKYMLAKLRSRTYLVGR